MYMEAAWAWLKCACAIRMLIIAASWPGGVTPVDSIVTAVTVVQSLHCLLLSIYLLTMLTIVRSPLHQITLLQFHSTLWDATIDHNFSCTFDFGCWSLSNCCHSCDYRLCGSHLPGPPLTGPHARGKWGKDRWSWCSTHLPVGDSPQEWGNTNWVFQNPCNTTLKCIKGVAQARPYIWGVEHDRPSLNPFCFSEKIFGFLLLPDISLGIIGKFGA